MTDNNTSTQATELKTPFYNCHVEEGAKMVPFAGFMMPIQYADGIMREHEWVRTRAGLFDVSHMGQCILKGKDAAANISRLTPSSFHKTADGRCRYTVLTNEKGGIIDDLIVTRLSEDTFYLVINAACRDKDLAWIKQNLTGDVTLEEYPQGTPLIALQGPYAEQVLSEVLFHKTDLSSLPYMHSMPVKVMGEEALITRSGYTGEDGFELSLPIPTDKAQQVWRTLIQHADVKPIGLGARDSLRLEMGFPLYGHDLDETTSPVEADISWVINKKNTGFMGEGRIREELQNGAEKKRIGIKLTEKGVAREGATLLSPDGKVIGTMTSGGFSPSTKQAIGQGYVDTAYAEPGKTVLVEVRNRRLRAATHELNFVNPRTLKPGA